MGKFLIAIALALASISVSAESADAREVRKGPFSAYARSTKAPLRSMARVYIRGRGEMRRANRAFRGPRVWGGGFLATATFRPDSLF